MDAVFKKLNYKGQSTVYCLQAPESFAKNLASIAPLAVVKTNLVIAKNIEFALVFVTALEQINTLVPKLIPLLANDAVWYMCYPKGTSKKYKCNFNRDNGWEIIGEYNYEPVRMVAIDEDWSALRFRQVENIKTLTRQFGTLSKAGKEKVEKGK
jgi:hypothetical protein